MTCGKRTGPGIGHPVGSHRFGHVEAGRNQIGDDDEPGADVARDGSRHDPDRPRPGDQDVFADQVERKGSVGGVAERVEDGADLIVDVVGQREHIAGGKGEVLGEGAGPGDAKSDMVVAEVAAPGPTIAAVAAGDVTLARNSLAHFETGDAFPDSTISPMNSCPIVIGIGIVFCAHSSQCQM